MNEYARVPIINMTKKINVRCL